MQTDRIRIVFAGGGTGGHLFPAIAIANEIKKLSGNAEITFIGTRHKIESKVVPQHGYGFKTIWVSGFRRHLTLENVLFPLKIIVALIQSLFLMKRINPHVVVGTGGYVCGPPLLAASLLGIPTVIQEQNSYPGVTTRLLASRADQVHLSFPESKRFLKRTDNVRVTGNPTREIVGRVSREDGARFFSIVSPIKTLLVFGGSLGASSINQAILNCLPSLTKRGIQVVWQTGEIDYQRIAGEARRLSLTELVKVHAFIDRMEYAYASCDLAVCRSGATTVAELAKAGVASILVPYPFAAADHQTENARAMVNAGAAVLIRDGDLDERLLETIEAIFADPAKMQSMRANALVLGNPMAATTIANAVLELARAGRGRA